MELQGKWALITGSTRGIGREIALALAERGCNIIVHGRTADKKCETMQKLASFDIQTKVIAAAMDNENGVQKIIDFVKEEVGTPAIIYNNAGIQNEWCNTFDNSMAVWREQFQVNLFSAVQISNAFIPDMIKAGYGRVINTTSDIESVPEMASYGAAKWAIRKMTSEFAVALEDSGVTITALDPGWLRTDLGGDEAPNDVSSVIPGALAPVISDLVKNGEVFSAQKLRNAPELQ